MADGVRDAVVNGVRAAKVESIWSAVAEGVGSVCVEGDGGAFVDFVPVGLAGVVCEVFPDVFSDLLAKLVRPASLEGVQGAFAEVVRADSLGVF